MSNVKLRVDPERFAEFKRNLDQARELDPEGSEEQHIKMARKATWQKPIKVRMPRKGGSTWTPNTPKETKVEAFLREHSQIGSAKPNMVSGRLQRAGGCACPETKKAGKGCGCPKKSKKKVKQEEGDGLAVNSPSAKVQQFLKTYGSWKLQRQGVVGRKPIQSLIQAAINTVALRKQEDKLMHLYLLPTITNGSQILKERMERNHVLQIFPAKASDQTGKDTEVRTFTIPTDMTVQQAFDKFIKLATARNPADGPWRYRAVPSGSQPSNNCQNMCIDFLKAVGALTPELQKFILQNAEGLVGSFWSRIGQAATDVAGRAQQLVGGEQEEKGGEGTIYSPGEYNKPRQSIWDQAQAPRAGPSGNISGTIPHRGGAAVIKLQPRDYLLA